MQQEPIIFNYHPEGDESVADALLALPQITLLINPTSLTLNWKKIITRTRTKSRIVSFYWGQEPVNFTYGGQTGNVYPTSREIASVVAQTSKARTWESTAISSERNPALKEEITRLETQLSDQLYLSINNPDALVDLQNELDDKRAELRSNESKASNLLIPIELDDLSQTELLEMSIKYRAFKKLQSLFEKSQNVKDLMQIKYRNYIFKGYLENFSFTDSGTNPWNWLYNISFTILEWDESLSNIEGNELLLVADEKDN